MGGKVKAVKAVAKATEIVGPPAIAAGTKAAEWMGKALGTLPEDVVGLALGDHVRYLRMELWELYARRIDEKLRKRGVKHPKPIGPKLAMPAIEAATLETDETLQELWANLLANAMDPNRDVSLKSMFIETLKAFHPVEAVILDRHVNMGQAGQQNIGHVASDMKTRFNEILLSAEHLESLGCLARPHALGLDQRLAGQDVFVPTALGHELWRAVQ